MSALVSVHPRRPASAAPADEGGSSAGNRGWATTGLVLAALVTAAAWLPSLHSPLTSDESGFLLVADQWRPGGSLYGDHWVDRPPLLIGLFSAAAHLGPTSATAAGVTAPAVKLLGATASGVIVILTGALARLVARESRWSRRAAVVTTAALLCSPLFGMPETDGELVAVPFVLLGLAALVVALHGPWGRRAVVLAAGAGGSAMAAALVKQNVIDVFVFGIVVVAMTRGRIPRLRARVAAFAGGAAAVLVAAAAGAWDRGTSPAGLWDAIVVFRIQASGVIGSSASAATVHRMTEVLVAFLASGAAVILVLPAAVVLARRLHRRGHATGDPADRSVASTPDLTWPVLAMTGWELCGVALGGSYWLHYLTGLLPGLVMMTLIVPSGRWTKRALTLAVGYAAAASVAVWAHDVAAPPAAVSSSDAKVTSYLRRHANPTDGVVVGFGHSDIVAGSGLRSPYEHLWSLPVRVRDPHLVELQEVMSGRSAPRWVVVDGGSLDTWGLNADEAEQYLERHYVEQVTYGDWHIWQRQEGAPR